MNKKGIRAARRSTNPKTLVRPPFASAAISFSSVLAAVNLSPLSAKVSANAVALPAFGFERASEQGLHDVGDGRGAVEQCANGGDDWHIDAQCFRRLR